jgi:uncharacterized RDD family membrane protein YckC
MAPAYAGLVTRSVAFVVDLLIVNAIALAVTAGIGVLVSGLDPGKGSVELPGLLVTAAGWLIFAAIYLVGFWVLVGHTPGMRLMGIRVTNTAWGEVTFWRGLRRLVGLALAFLSLGIGFLLILVDDRRRGLQDRIGGTLVIRM